MSSSDERPLVVVLVGTDHHPFHRLVSWASELAAAGWADWFVQFGESPWPEHRPTNLSGDRLVDEPTLRALVDRASCVVCHAGPGLLMDATAAGHRPVVVARDPAFGEHVDGHQLQFARRMAQADRIDAVADLDSLRVSVQRSIAAPRAALAAQHASSQVCERLASMVEEAVARHQSTRRVRLGRQGPRVLR